MEAAAGSAGSATGAQLSVAQMVVANRPWRLVRDLSKVLVAAVATAGFFVTNSNAWTISDQLEGWRLLLVALAAFAGLLVWIIVAHGLWERPSASEQPDATKLVNAATVLTLALGLLLGFVVLYLMVLGAMALAIPASFAAESIGHEAGAADYLLAAWFATSMATVAGALGSGLESDEEVRETVSRYRPRLGRDSSPAAR
jgi:hypothetical protein